jgi:hypothetical protein
MADRRGRAPPERWTADRSAGVPVAGPRALSAHVAHGSGRTRRRGARDRVETMVMSEREETRGLAMLRRDNWMLGCRARSEAGWECSLQKDHEGRHVALVENPVQVMSTWNR